MSRRQVTPRPYPPGLSPAGACSTSNRGIGKRRGFKGAPACKTAGKICSKETMKPSAGELRILTAVFGSLECHVTHAPVNAIKAHVKPHAPLKRV